MVLSSMQHDDEDLRALYKQYLRTEMYYRQLKMKKLHKEIALLDRQLDVSNYVKHRFA